MTKMIDKEMMKEDINKRITELLARYYDGETTPEQTSELIELFGKADSLPPVLQEERKIFLTLEGCRPDGVAVPVPSGLEERLAEAIDGFEAAGAPAKRSSRGFLRRLAVASAAAAVVIVTLTLGWKAMNIVNDTPDLNIVDPGEQAVAISEQTDSSDNDTLAPSLASDMKADENATEAAQPKTETKPAETKAPARKKAPRLKSSRNMAYSQPAEHKPKANIHVITDPEEASMFIDQMHVRFRRNINEAEMTSAKTGDVIESINRIIISNDL